MLSVMRLASTGSLPISRTASSVARFRPSVSAITALTGIGRWTADVYLLFALRRADAWPSGDLALIKAVHEVRVTRAPVSSARVDAIENIRPSIAIEQTNTV